MRPREDLPSLWGNLARMKAREYLRVSKDASGRLRSVEDQHGDNERTATAEGWDLGTPYLENGAVSASRYGHKARPGFGALVTDLERGTFGADLLVLWEPSRGSRRMSEWTRFLELAEDRGVKLHITSHGQTYDPSSPRDRRTLHEDGVDSEYESGKTSERVKRAMSANAAAGRPHGRTPYGYRRKYELTQSGKRILLGQFPEPAEARVITGIFEAIAARRSLRWIAADLNARGVPTVTGSPWTQWRVRDIAVNPVYAGLRAHHAGRRGGHERRSELGELTDGTWPAIVEPELFWRVYTYLTDPSRCVRRPGREKHLLSLIAACGPCGGPLTATYRRGPREYTCRDKGCVRISADELDQYAEEVMFAYVAQDDVIAELRAGQDGPGSELARVRGDLGAARAELASLRKLGARPFGDPQRLSAAALAEIEPGLVGKVTELESRERELSVPPALAGLITPGKDVRSRWRDAPVSARREVARMLCSSAILGQLRVTRSPSPGRKVEARDRVTWDRVQDQ